MIKKWKKEDSRALLEMVDIDALIPKRHKLRKLDEAICWGEIYDIAQPYYSVDTGRPSVDPVVLVKLVTAQHIYGFKSLRATIMQTADSLSLRWFIGYSLKEKIPSVSTAYYTFKKRIPKEAITQILTYVLTQAAEKSAMTASAIGFSRRGKAEKGTDRKPSLSEQIDACVKK